MIQLLDKVKGRRLRVEKKGERNLTFHTLWLNVWWKSWLERELMWEHNLANREEQNKKADQVSQKDEHATGSRK